MSLSPAEKGKTKKKGVGWGGGGELISTYLTSLKKELTVRVDWVVSVTLFFSS